ncbi:MAG: TIGR02453 family protein [Rhodocyclales bacterium GT-UBC]|nr:MAG: TIGR02453 family protein [Rhodocyclales bacterium GT-UBC]
MFTISTFHFLNELAQNNSRAWFAQNAWRYETLVCEPALNFIEAMAPKLREFAPHFQADARKTGGSLLRIFRDTRFSHDKTPYKTNIGLLFRHAQGKDIHAPSYYLHIANEECFLGAGCWHPGSHALQMIRTQIADSPDNWLKIRDDEKFLTDWKLAGASLTRPPRGFSAEQPAIEDIKRKDFVAVATLTPNDVTSPAFAELVAKRFASATPLVNYLCRAQQIRY